MQTIATRLGHVKATTTTSIYSHLLKKPDIEAANKLDKIFDKQRNINGETETGEGTSHK